MAKKTKIFLSLAVIAAAIIFYAHLEPYWIQVKETEVISQNIPQEFSGKKIAFIADLHCGNNFSPKRLESVVKQVNSLNPDIIILGGDYVNSSGKDNGSCLKELSALEAPLGKFAVMGNHDKEAGAKNVADLLNGANINLLINQNKTIAIDRAAITIAGVDETWYGQPDGKKALQEAADFSIFVSHDPWYLEQYHPTKSQLALAAHTHGGQVTLFGFWLPGMVFHHNLKYPSGIFRENNQTIIVTNGIGATMLPIRFMARPQINLITLSSSR